MYLDMYIVPTDVPDAPTTIWRFTDRTLDVCVDFSWHLRRCDLVIVEAGSPDPFDGLLSPGSYVIVPLEGGNNATR